MLTGRDPIPDTPGWFIGKINRGFDPDRGGEYTEIHLHVDDQSAPVPGVGPGRVLVHRVPGRVARAEIAAIARRRAIEVVLSLPEDPLMAWLGRWCEPRLDCTLCEQKVPECVCPEGPYLSAVQSAKVISELRAELEAAIRA